MTFPLSALDDWQKEFLQTEGNKMLLCGRQIGKSVICAMDAAEFALKNPKKVILIIAPTERQAFALFDKALAYIVSKAPAKIKKGRERPTKHLITLTNDAKIYSLPTGLSGVGIRFLTIDRLYIDECQDVPKAVETAVTPMLLTTGGASVYLGTPKGAENFFAEEFEDPESDFKKFSKSSMEVMEQRKFSKYWSHKRKADALAHIARARRRMSALEFAQEYEGRIIRDLVRLISDELIAKSCILPRDSEPVPGSKAYLGADIARLGGDQTVLIALSKYEDGEKMRMFFLDISERTYLTETITRIKLANKKYDFMKIYIDSTGIGAGVLDVLMEDDNTRRKVEGIENAQKSIVFDDSRKKRVMKEELYANLIALMEQGKLKLFEDNELILSLKSLQYEYKEGGGLRIFGNYTHCAEALVRAAWGYQDKTLNMWIY